MGVVRLRAGLAICACGWSGELAAKDPCPACARPAIDRMDPARIAALRGVRDRDAPLDRMMRVRLIQIGVLSPRGKRPARGADGRIYRGTANRSHLVTPLGLAAIATADRLLHERIAEQARHDVAASVARHADLVILPPASSATAAVIDAMLSPYTRRTP